MSFETQREARSPLASLLSALTALALLLGTASACKTAEEPPVSADELPVPPGIESFPLEVVVANRLNVRAGPGTEHPIVGKLPQGAQVRVLEQMDGWKRVRPDAGGLEGWAAGEYLQSQPNP